MRPALPPETAYYYPEPYWLAREGGWIKTLLLFFDGVAILLPEYMRGRNVDADPTLAEPLEDRGLLKVLEPETFVDEEATANLTDMVQWLIEEKAFDDLPRAMPAELSMSRMGYAAIHEAAHRVYESLAARGLALESEDGVSIPMHPFVRAVYLILLAQLAWDTGARHGLDLLPTTNGRGAIDIFERYLQLPPMPSRGRVITFDLAAVSIDLDEVPLDEVLAFRDENLDAHRHYMENLRTFSLEISRLDEAERARAFADRQAELEADAPRPDHSGEKGMDQPEGRGHIWARSNRRGVGVGDSQPTSSAPDAGRGSFGDGPGQGPGLRLRVPVRGEAEPAVEIGRSAKHPQTCIRGDPIARPLPPALGAPHRPGRYL